MKFRPCSVGLFGAIVIPLMLGGCGTDAARDSAEPKASVNATPKSVQKKRAEAPAAKVGKKGILNCSFCGKSQKEVKKLIAGPQVYICDECVAMCNEILAMDDKSMKPTQTIEGIAQREKVGPSVHTANGSVWVDLPDWPDHAVGKRVKVTGTFVERKDLPVFIDKPGEPIRAGMAVPEGTDLEKARTRQVLSKITWKLLE